MLSPWFSLVTTKVRNTEEQLIKLLLSSLLPIFYYHWSPSVLTMLRWDMHALLYVEVVLGYRN